MKTRIIIGANAYCHITTDSTSLDVLLSPGRSASRSLRESAQEMREKAERMIARAALMEQAADQLEEQA